MNKILLTILLLVFGNYLTATEGESLRKLWSLGTSIALSYGVFLGYNFLSASIHEASHHTAYHLVCDKKDRSKHSRIPINLTRLGAHGRAKVPMNKLSPNKQAFVYGAGPIGSMFFNGLTLCIATHPAIRSAAIVDSLIQSKNSIDLDDAGCDGYRAFKHTMGRYPTSFEKKICNVGYYGILLPATLYATIKYA